MSRRGFTVGDASDLISARALSAGTSILGLYQIAAPFTAERWWLSGVCKGIIMGRPVALFLLDDDVAQREDLVRCFEEKMRKIKALNNPRLLQIKEVFREDGLVGVAHGDLPSASSLSDELNARGLRPWSLEDASDWIGPALEALSALHREGVVLGNIEASGVYRRNVGKSELVLSKVHRLRLLPPSLDEPREGPEGLSIAEARCMAPEWWLLSEEVGGAADLYSIGVLLYRMLLGRYPIHGETLDDLRAGHELGLDDTSLTTLSVGARRLLNKALSRDTAHRFEDAQAFIRGLVDPSSLPEPTPRGPLKSRLETSKASQPPKPEESPTKSEVKEVESAEATDTTRNEKKQEEFEESPSEQAPSPADIISGRALRPGKKKPASPSNPLDEKPEDQSRAKAPSEKSEQPSSSKTPKRAPEGKGEEGKREEGNKNETDSPKVTLSTPQQSFPLWLLAVAIITALALGGWWFLTPRLGDEFEAETAQVDETAESWLNAMDRAGEDLVLIPGGASKIGVPKNRFPWKAGQRSERVIHLSPFFIQRREVTRQDFARCVKKNRCETPKGTKQEGGQLREPVVNVTWRQANAYCHFLGLRLPTESEWEKAASGQSGQAYAWGDTAQCRGVNVHETGCGEKKGARSVDEPGADISPYGVWGMGGNVWEWTADWYGDAPRARSGVVPLDPQGPSRGPGRVIKGGSWGAGIRTSHAREWNTLEEFSEQGGFRCAVSAQGDLEVKPPLKTGGSIFGEKKLHGADPDDERPETQGRMKKLFGAGATPNVRLNQYLLGGNPGAERYRTSPLGDSGR